MRFTKVGLTGGIGTGKSTVAGVWRDAGAETIDADDLAHQTLVPETATWRAIVAEFGDGVLNADRTINRARLGGIVFGDDARRAALNGIVHPVVQRLWREWLEPIQAAGRSHVAVVTIPLLYEVGVEGEFDVVVCVACSDATQQARLTAKGLSAAQAQARIQAQWPLAQKMERADFVIWNDGTRDVLGRQAAVIWSIMQEHHHAA